MINTRKDYLNGLLKFEKFFDFEEMANITQQEADNFAKLSLELVKFEARHNFNFIGTGDWAKLMRVGMKVTN